MFPRVPGQFVAGHPVHSRTPPAEVLTADELAVIEDVTEAERLRPPQERVQPVGPHIRSWVVLLARVRGRRPKKHRE